MPYNYNRRYDIFESYYIPVGMCILSIVLLLLAFVPDWWSMESDNAFVQSVILKFRTEYTGIVVAGVINLIIGVCGFTMIHHARKKK